MSGKPLKSVGRARKAGTGSRMRRKGGETAAVKRTQGRMQAAGGAARPSRLIQPRKKIRYAGGEAFKRAEASTEGARLVSAGGPAGVAKTVARIQRSAYELGRPRSLPAARGVGATNQKEEP